VCSWDPFSYPFQGHYDQPCRRQFKDVNEYNTHRLEAHSGSWHNTARSSCCGCCHHCRGVTCCGCAWRHHREGGTVLLSSAGAFAARRGLDEALVGSACVMTSLHNGAIGHRARGSNRLSYRDRPLPYLYCGPGWRRLCLILSATGWYCPACDYKNTALFFPRCEACDNTLDKLGKDMVKDLKAKFTAIMIQLWGDEVGEKLMP
jgi:hypothetical protein